MSESDITWAAGLFEGEGCFTVRRGCRRHWRAMLEMTIKMTDRDVLERFQSIVEVGTLTTRQKPQKPHWKQQHTWRVSGERALRVASILEPYLCHRRTERLNEIREIIAKSKPVPRSCECCANVFMPTRFDRERFCSERCRDRSKYLRRRYGITHDFLEDQLSLVSVRTPR